MAPAPTLGFSTQTLYSLLHPETIHFCFKTEQGRRLIVPINASNAYSCSEPQPDDDIDSEPSINGELPTFSFHEIDVLEVFVGPCVVSQVQVNG
ncbi:uncharacterized protein PV06_08297 [Exophiala oligosperma]|uniref:Uncharacterized protein n=2 Tax=Chaetothyriales TaxID=34395 RepID=A0A0D2D9A9_9EURO|nr:uncharacterized protein PV06_08297 [Exophiala oligosperma]KAJ9644792.1 hypothetical protein H2204_001254 [Knufia peltigerae]KIW39708.1 hypothetical protein PV06_08297 [Exophiala oligosperma]